MESIKKSGNLLSVIITIGVIALGAVALVRYGDAPKTTTGSSAVSGTQSTSTETAKTICEKQGDSTTPLAIPGFRKEDHVCGARTARVVVVEYSDFECPFCKSFHQTMLQVAEQYTGKVAWVYRHFPLDGLHSRARNEAEASECAYDQMGEVGFWKFANKVFAVTSSNNTLSPELLPVIASEIGLNRDAFNTCLVSKKNAPKVSADAALGSAVGTTGTPFSVVYLDGKQVDTFAGALPFDNVKAKLDLLLGSIK